MGRTGKGILALLVALALPGCARKAPVDANVLDDAALRGALSACCANTDQYPLGVVKVVEGAAFSIVPASRAILLRAPYLQEAPDAARALLGRARPLDMILIANEAHLSGALGTGYFGHSLLYFGGEAGLRGLGLWEHPLVRPYQDKIRAGALAIEAIEGGVRLANARQVMDSDASALLRPRGLSPARKRAAVLYLFEQIGAPFDVHFDLATERALFCTELIHNALPEMALPVTMAYGRQVIWPDEVAARSLIGATGFALIAYMRGRPGGWEWADWRRMAADILAAWPAPESGAGL